MLPEGLILKCNKRVNQILRAVIILDKRSVLAVVDAVNLLALIIIYYRASLNCIVYVISVNLRSEADSDKSIQKGQNAHCCSKCNAVEKELLDTYLIRLVLSLLTINHDIFALARDIVRILFIEKSVFEMTCIGIRCCRTVSAF